MKVIKNDAKTGVTPLDLTQEVNLTVKQNQRVPLNELRDVLDQMARMLGGDHAYVYIRQFYNNGEFDIKITNTSQE